MKSTKIDEADDERVFTSAEIGALAHLYRGEVYRSTLWRSRLDMTTNWSVVSLGIALSISYASDSASPLPLLLVGILISFFLVLESRRYRYFNVWRARCRWMEKHLYASMLRDGDLRTGTGWQDVLACDYEKPKYHITLLRAVGRRLRRNYIWILTIQTTAYFGKIFIHPTPLSNIGELFDRAAVGPISGSLVLFCGVLFTCSWLSVAVTTWYLDRVKHGGESTAVPMG